MKKLAVLVALAYVALAIVSNWLASKYVVSVPLTRYVAPAGVFTIGVCFVLRDWLAQLTRTRYALAVIPVAGGLSYAIGVAAGYGSLQKIAVASLAAFVASESLEALVFAPLRKRKLAVGVLASGLVGNALDSWLFLTLAFGSTAFFAGNFVGKAEMIVVGAALTVLRRAKAPVIA